MLQQQQAVGFPYCFTLASQRLQTVDVDPLLQCRVNKRHHQMLLCAQKYAKIRSSSLRPRPSSTIHYRSTIMMTTATTRRAFGEVAAGRRMNTNDLADSGASYLVCWNSERQYVHFTTRKLPRQLYKGTRERRQKLGQILSAEQITITLHSCWEWDSSSKGYRAKHLLHAYSTWELILFQ